MKAKNLHVGYFRFRSWVPALAWAGVIFILSSIPGDVYPAEPVVNADKLVHAGVYLILGILCVRGFVLGSALAGSVRHVLGAGLATIYGVSDELHQLFVRNRSCDVWDAVADLIGASLGAVAVLYVPNLLREFAPSSNKPER